MLPAWIFIVMINSCLASLTWREQPTNKLVFEGEVIHLKCRTASGLGAADHHHWVKLNPTSGQQIFLTDSGDVSTVLSPDVQNRYNIRFNHNLGQYDLYIQQAKWYDSGQYGCMVYNRLPGRRIMSRFASVNVVPRQIPTGSPECTLIPAHPAPGDLVQFTCISSVRNALSTLSWTRGTEAVSATTLVNSRKNKVVTFSRRLQDTDNHAVYSCTEQYPLAKSPTAACRLVPFDIPMNVSLRPAGVRAVVGTPLTFSCLAEAVPPISRYYWLFDGHPVQEKPGVFQIMDGGRRLRIKGVLSAAEAQYEVRCKVVNALNMRRSAIAYIKVLSSGSNESVFFDQATPYPNMTVIPGKSNKALAGDKKGIAMSDTRNLFKVRNSPVAILLAATTAIGATLLLIFIAILVVCLRRRSKEDNDDDEVADEPPRRIVEISPPSLGEAQEPVPPVREMFKSRHPHLPAKDGSNGAGKSGKSPRLVRHSYQPLRRDRSDSLERVTYTKQSKSVSLYENAVPLRLSFPENQVGRPPPREPSKGSRPGQGPPISI